MKFYKRYNICYGNSNSIRKIDISRIRLSESLTVSLTYFRSES